MKRIVAVAALTVLALAGCAPEPAPVESSAPPVVTPTPTPTPTVEPITAPTPLLDLDCNELIGDGIDVLFAKSLSSWDPARTIAEAGTTVPYKYDIEQLGGLTCEWSNGTPQSDKLGGDPNYVGLAVSVAPVTQDQWTPFRDYYGVSDNRQVYCFTDTGNFCAADAFVDGRWWLEVQATGTDGVKASVLSKTFKGIVSDMIATVTNAAPSGAVWSAPEDTIPLDSNCATILTGKQVATAVATTKTVEPRFPQGGVSLDGTSREALDALWCTYSFADSDDGVGILTWLPGGEWAWNEARDFNLPGGAIVELDVAGLDEGEGAWVRCADSNCVLDLVVGHNWITFQLYSDDDGATPGQPALETIAADIVANLKG
jgi:hypothetical protein